MSETTDVGRLWAEIEGQLPAGWQLEGLRCASTSLAPGDRSEDWLAVAVGPGGETRTHRAAAPEDALRGLLIGSERSKGPGPREDLPRPRARP